MKYLHSVFITIITISCNICFESFKIANQTLYEDIVDYGSDTGSDSEADKWDKKI